MKNSFFLVLAIFAILLTAPIVSCSTGKISANSSDLEKIKIPEGWTKQPDNQFESITAPDGDLKIYFHKLKISKDFDFSKNSNDLWKIINPSFSYKEKRKVSPPSTDGWDKITQIIYDTPSEESKIVLSLLREKDGVAYINLVTSSLSTISKRGPQMSTILDSWKPESIKKDDLSSVKAKDFIGEVEKNFDSFLVRTKKDLNIPGFAIGIIQDGKIVYKRGFGQTSIKNGTTINSDTLFMIGSTTKPLTTLMMSKLVNDGKLKWEDPISRYLQNWELKDEKDSQNMLIKHSACGCTGMPRRDLDFIFQIEGITAEQRMREMKEMSPTTKPGETFQYSNYLVAAGGFSAAKSYYENHSLLNAYEKAMSDLVFKPLNMKRTLVINQYPYEKNSALPHSYNLSLEPELISTKLEEFANSVAPAGSIWSNIDDMLNYVQLELTKGQSVQNYIDEANLLKRREKGIKITDEMSYGLGLFVENYKGLNIVHHGGNTLGFTSSMFFIPEKNIGVVALINLGSANTFRSSIRKKLIELLFNTDTKAEEGISFYIKESNKSIKKLQDKIKPQIKNREILIGNYLSKELGQLKIYSNKDKLYADFGEFTSLIKEKKNAGKKRVFLLMSSPWMGSFELIKDGTNLVIDDDQKKYIFKKI
ncbi:MAG: hypothetical protein COV37_16395 [Bdellovibrio sp. CG11_big_fil_rev_8_21_14_0_20_39_38]|nr:MAG: hypothetical protein COV37_16395 [Bdellovibrio sp. CG11_big_fil_rev_8_21_14_0_20_39_38]